MSNVAVIVFDDEMQAHRGARALGELAREKRLTRYAEAIVTRTADGEEMLCSRLRTGSAGTWMALLMGGAVGLLRWPLGIAFGVGTGILVGSLLDLIARAAIRKEFLDAVSPHLHAGRAALVTEIEEVAPSILDTRMKSLGGEVFRRGEIQGQSSDSHVMSPGGM
jgi:uncharacterized membrane protein